jgi:hypothetical protein
MCWSASASIAVTVLGGAATGYAVKKKVPKARAFALAFFTLMELLQAISYIWINQCDMSGNVLLTNLSYIHIAFQIPVANILMLSFISEKKRKKWFMPVMVISFIATILMLTKLFVPMIWNIPKELMCKIGDPLCGVNSCSYEGSWHLAWRLPLLGFDAGFFIYFSTVFILPILYGCWRFSIFHFIFGPLLSWLLTTDSNEAPAIWCLFSIAILCAIFLKPLKRWLETPMRK